MKLHIAWSVFSLTFVCACSDSSGSSSDTGASSSASVSADSSSGSDAVSDSTSSTSTSSSTSSLASSTDAASADSGASDADECSTITSNVQWVSIVGGTFSMGCLASDTACTTAESPLHSVTVASFSITKTEVTRAQYFAAIGAYPAKYNADSFPDCTDSCPIDGVSWSEAAAYCEAIGGRLPTEAEWEFASRGTSDSVYLCGSDSTCLDSVAWHSGNSNGTIHPVGQKQANSNCLFDIEGNVIEWTADYWHATYDSAPTDGSAWVDPTSSYRVERGGSYLLAASLLRTSYRRYDSAGIYYNAHPGIRCVK